MIDSNTINRNLIKNTGIIGIGRISTKIVTFLLLPLYTSRLSASEYGTVDLLVTYGTLLFPIVNLQLKDAIFKYSVENRDDIDEVKRIISSGFFTSLAFVAIYLLLFYGLNVIFVIPHPCFLVIYVISSVLLSETSCMARGLGNNICYAFANFLSSFLVVISGIILVAWMDIGEVGLLIAYIVGPIFGTIYLFVCGELYKYLSVKDISIERIKVLLKYSLPLVPNELSWWVLHASDRTIVNFFLGVAATGVLAVANKFSLIYTTIFQIFYASWVEQCMIVVTQKEGIIYIQETLHKIMIFIFFASITFISVMPFLFPIMVNSQYFEGYSLVPLYIIAALFNAVIGLLSPIYLSRNETKIVAMTTIIAGIINIVVNILLITYMGLIAAAISSVCGYSIVAVLRIIDINKRHLKLLLSIKEIMIAVILTIFVLIAYYYNILVVNALISLMLIIVTCWVNKDIIGWFIRTFIRKKCTNK